MKPSILKVKSQPDLVTFWADIPRFARRFCRVEESPQPGGGAKEDFASISCRTFPWNEIERWVRGLGFGVMLGSLLANKKKHHDA